MRRIEQAYLPGPFRSLPIAAIVFSGEELRVSACSDQQLEYWGKSWDEIAGRPAAELLSAERTGIIRKVYSSGVAEQQRGVRFSFQRLGKTHTGYYDYIYQPWLENGEMLGVIAVITEVTENYLEKKQIEVLTNNILSLANAMPQLVWIGSRTV